jgi:hypothetical protein
VAGVTPNIWDLALPQASVRMMTSTRGENTMGNTKTSVGWLVLQKVPQIERLSRLMTR